MGIRLSQNHNLRLYTKSKKSNVPWKDPNCWMFSYSIFVMATMFCKFQQTICIFEHDVIFPSPWVKQNYVMYINLKDLKANPTRSMV